MAWCTWSSRPRTARLTGSAQQPVTGAGPADEVAGQVDAGQDPVQPRQHQVGEEDPEHQEQQGRPAGPDPVAEQEVGVPDAASTREREEAGVDAVRDGVRRSSRRLLRTATVCRNQRSFRSGSVASASAPRAGDGVRGRPLLRRRIGPAGVAARGTDSVEGLDPRLLARLLRLVEVRRRSRSRRAGFVLSLVAVRSLPLFVVQAVVASFLAVTAVLGAVFLKMPLTRRDQFALGRRRARAGAGRGVRRRGPLGRRQRCRDLGCAGGGGRCWLLWPSHSPGCRVLVAPPPSASSPGWRSARRPSPPGCCPATCSRPHRRRVGTLLPARRRTPW